MKYDEQIRYYAARHNLLEEDAEFMIGLLRSALNKRTAECANICAACFDKMETAGVARNDIIGLMGKMPC